MTKALILILAVLVAGCSHHHASDDPNATATKLGESQADPRRNAFETASDPPISADTHFAAGQLAESQNNSATAVKQYEAALKIEPNHLRAMYRLAMLYTQTKQFPKAIETWQRYAKITKDTATAYSNLGFCYELAGQPEQAEEAYHKGLAADSHSQPCRVNYGLMLARLGKMNDALNQLQVVLTPAEAHYDIASVYEQQGKREQAKAEYKKSIELDKNFLDAQTRLDALILKSAAAQ